MLYNDENRGIIQNRERARQIIDFSSLRYGNITPTDIDGLIEYHNKAYIFYEYKYQNAELPKGQKIALERIANDLSKTKETIILICEHTENNCNNDIIAAKAIIRAIYYKGKWGKPIESMNVTVDNFTNRFLKFIDNKEIKKIT